MAIPGSRIKRRRVGGPSEDELLELLSERFGKQGQAKANPLQRVFAPLRAITSVPDVIYKGMYEDKNPILEYMKNIGRGLGTTFMGHEDQELKKTSDIAMKEGYLLSQDTGTKAARFGLDLAGDIATSPLTYLGFLPMKIGAEAAKQAVKAAAGASGKANVTEKTINSLASKVVDKPVTEAIKIIQGSKLGQGGAEAFYTNLLATQNLKAAGGLKFMGKTISESPKVADAVKMAINPLYGAAKGAGALGTKVAPEGMKALKASWYDIFDPLKAAAMSGKDSLALQALKTQIKEGQIGQDALMINAPLMKSLEKIPKEKREGATDFLSDLFEAKSPLGDLIQQTKMKGGEIVFKKGAPQHLAGLSANEAVRAGLLDKSIGDFLNQYGEHAATMTRQLAKYVGTDKLIHPMHQTYLQQIPKSMDENALNALFSEGAVKKILQSEKVQNELAKGTTSFDTVREALRGTDVLAGSADKSGMGLRQLIEKTFPTMAEGRKAGIVYENSVEKILEQQTSGQLKRLTAYEFGNKVQDMADMLGNPYFVQKASDQYSERVLLPGVLNDKGKPLSLYTDPQTKKVMQNYFDQFGSDSGLDKTLEGFDKVMYMWKGLVTGKGPGMIRYHTRNHFDDNLRMILGGADIRTLPADYLVSGDLLKYNSLISEVGEEEAKKQFTSEAINKYLKSVGRENDTVHTLWKEMKDTGTLSDVGRAYDEAAIRYVAGKGTTGQKFLAKGSEFEQYRRMAMYLNNFRKTGNTIEASQSVRETLFNYLELSKTERNVMKRLMPFYCVPEESMALTRVGWKNHDDIKIGEDLLTYSIEKDEYEWQPVKAVNVFDHNQDLISLSNTRHEILFTPEHRWVVEKHKQKIKRPYGTYEYPMERKVVTGKELNTLNSIKVSSEYRGTVETVSVEDARLLGWLLTDGYFRSRGKHIEAVIYQHPNKFLDEVKKVAGGKPRKSHPISGTVCVPVLKERVDRIAHLLDRDKRKDDWCDVVGMMSREGMEAMYNAMYKADGTVSEGRKQDSLACSSKEGVARTFEMLATLLGYRVTRTQRGYSVSKFQRLRIAGMEKKMKHYTGKVWCPTTKNGTWVMKQDNFITITGNSFTKNNLKFQFNTMIHEPGKYSRFINVMDSLQNAMIGPDEEKWDLMPEWLKEDRYSIPLGEKDGALRVMSNFGLSFEDLEDLDLQGSVSKMNPLLKLFIEQATGQSTFQKRPIEELRGGQRYEHHPLRSLLGYQERERDGRTQKTVDPQRRYMAENLPFVSTVNLLLQQMGRTGGPLLDKETPARESLTGLQEWMAPMRTYEQDLGQAARWQEVEELDELYKLLYRKGISDRFTRYYIPADIREKLIKELMK